MNTSALLPTAPPLTAQQRAALEARDRSVSLAAGAGCGKTFVLTERFISHLDPADADAVELDELIAITFTDAAAREMRDRIRRRCFERMQAATNRQEAAAWQRLMRSMDAARISTIHSFCAELLRARAVEAGLDPQFEVLDAAAAALLKLETVDDRLRALLLAGNEDVLDLAAKRGLERLRTEVADLAGPRSADVVAIWHDKTPEELVAAWEEFFEQKIAGTAATELLGSHEIQQLRQSMDADRARSDKLRQHLAELARALEECKVDSASQSLDRLRALAKVQGVCTAKDWHDAEDYAAFRDACKALRDCLDKSILKRPLDPTAALEAACQGLALLRLVADVSAALVAAKARRNQLEFDDLLARAHALLTDPQHAEIRRQSAKSSRLVMVDEFQDTNPLQMAIVEAVCGNDWRERGLFAVGDFKQSIYRFNGAEPEVSLRLREALPPPSRLSLTTNFRSQPAITNFVNAVFHNAFDNYEPLEPSRPQATAEPAVEFMWTPCEDADECDDDAPPKTDRPQARRRQAGAVGEARRREAQWIARRLAELLESPDPLVVEDVDGAPQPRRLLPGDVAILLRSLSDAQVYEEALRDQGLEYYLAGGHAFYSQQEVYDLLNLLRAVASLVDEIALAGALRSPLFSLADETLFWLVETHGSLNAGLAAARPPQCLSAAEAAKFRRARATLSRLRTEKDRRLVADLLALALELTGYDAVLLTEFLGPRKAANVEKLVEQARVLDQTSPGDLQGYITQLSEFVVRAPKEALAATQAEGNVIRIMTFHYAKGLEFPLVVLPDLDRRRHPGHAQAVLHKELGPLVPLERDDKKTSIGLDLYRCVENVEDIEERKRLFYVACTRARDYLILSSSLADADHPKRDWLQLVNEQIHLADGTLRGPLPAGYDAPVVRVTTNRPGVDGAAAESRGPDLVRLVAKTRELAQKAPGELPRGAARIGVDARARRRFSFSALTGHLTPDVPLVNFSEIDAAELLAPPAAAARNGADYDGRQLGTLVHAVMERIDFRHPENAADLCTQLAPQFIDRAPEQAAAEAAAIIQRFLATPRARTLASTPIVRREVEFVLPWPPAGEFTGRYLHGFIDCLYQDKAGQWRLLDFKSNRIAANQVSQAAARYEMQLLVYNIACERALGQPLAECTLALLHPGIEHAYQWDDAARQKGVDWVTAAMEALMVAEAAAPV